MCPALQFFQKYEATDYEPAIFGKVIQKSHGFIIFSGTATNFQKVSCAYRKMMIRISTYFPVASTELHAVLEMVANVKEKEHAKKSADMKKIQEMSFMWMTTVPSLHTEIMPKIQILVMLRVNY